ncbi:MAG: hypothetical protein J3K34DRAFT_425419 [Monoraphidium minutum]|nr:MAG: hypothetical protein J3K34DRAFT_425419 [Monoraphidium minutum]
MREFSRMMVVVLLAVAWQGQAMAAPRGAPGVQSVLCKLDASGRVADLQVTLDTAGAKPKASCTKGDAPPPGGRVVALDLSDGPVTEVQYRAAGDDGPLEWVAFTLASGAMRVCGARSGAAATVATAGWSRAAGKHGGGGLSALGLQCAGRKDARRVRRLRAPKFAAGLPVEAEQQGVVPKCCKLAFSRAGRASDADAKCCKQWVDDNRVRLQEQQQQAEQQRLGGSTETQCPPTADPEQLSLPITKPMLPVARPPNWTYRNTSISASAVLTPAKFLQHGAYITAQVVHDPVPGVTSEMVEWWFNGNVDGDMTLNGAVWPRYLVWHPRDHLSQTTLLPGPVAGNATGAAWSIIEFFMSNNATGYLRSSPRGSWSANYETFIAITVHQLDRNTLDMRITIPYFNTVPLRLLHEWKDVTVDGKPALACTSTMYIGIQPPIDSPFWSLLVNPIVFKIFGGNCPVKAAEAWTKHAIEETGNFQYFLPELFRTAGPGSGR